jgi:hypothetical protein
MVIYNINEVNHIIEIDGEVRLHSCNQRRICMKGEKTSIQLNPNTRDRLYKLKFRRTYDQFLNELCDLYEDQEAKK